MFLWQECGVAADRVPDMDPDLSDALVREANKQVKARDRAAK